MNLQIYTLESRQPMGIEESISYRGYLFYCELSGLNPVSKTIFESINWLTTQHQMAWVRVNESYEHRLALSLYATMGSTKVSAKKQTKALQGSFKGIDLRDIVIKDTMHIDDFVNGVINVFSSRKHRL